MNKDEFLACMDTKSEPQFCGTGCYPPIRATYLELVDLFGEPCLEGDGLEFDCEFSFIFKGTSYLLRNDGDGVAAQGFEGIPTDYLDEWHLYSSEKNKDIREAKADELRAILSRLCPMEKYPKLEMAEVFAAKKKMTTLSQRGLVQVIALIHAWEGDIFPDRRTPEEIVDSAMEEMVGDAEDE